MKSMIKLLFFSFLIIFLSCNETPRFSVGTRLTIPIAGRPVSPGDGYFWIDGEWFWNGGSYSWRDGYWSNPHDNYRWSPGHWRKRRGDQWQWHQGRWR